MLRKHGSRCDDLIGQLYEATARHFRDIRVVEIEKMEQRSKSENKCLRAFGRNERAAGFIPAGTSSAAHRSSLLPNALSVQDLAADIWDAAELAEVTPLAEWIGRLRESDAVVNIPEERPAELMEKPPMSGVARPFVRLWSRD
jgi:hypothetical protein